MYNSEHVRLITLDGDGKPVRRIFDFVQLLFDAFKVFSETRCYFKTCAIIRGDRLSWWKYIMSDMFVGNET